MIYSAIAGITAIGLILLPFVLFGMDILFFVNRQEKPVFELLAFLIGGIYVMLALAEVFLPGGVYVGCGLSLVWLLQLVCGARPEGIRFGGSDIFFPVCLCVLPCIYLFHAVCLMVGPVREKARKQQALHYDNPFLQRLNLWFLKGANLFLAVVALLPISGILSILLILPGQQPDTILLAFTRTSDWILSAETAPSARILSIFL